MDNLNRDNLCDGETLDGKCCEYPAVCGVWLPEATRGRRYTWLCQRHSREVKQEQRQAEREAVEVSV